MPNAAIRQTIIRAISAVAALAAGAAAFDAGVRMAGTLLGAVMAVNAGIFAALLAGAIAERALRPGGRSEERA